MLQSINPYSRDGVPSYRGNKSNKQRLNGVNGSPQKKKSLKRKREVNETELPVSKKRKLTNTDFRNQPSRKYLLQNVVDTRAFEFVDSDKIVTSDKEGTLQTHRLNGEIGFELKGHKSYVTCLHKKGDFLVSGGYDNTVRLWNLKKGGKQEFIGHHEDRVIAVHYNGKFIASGSKDGVVKIWDLSSPKAKVTIKLKDAKIYHEQSLFLTDDLLYVGSTDRTIKMFDISSGDLMKTYSGHLGLVSCVLVTEDSIISASGVTIKVRNKQSGAVINLRGHNATIYSLLYSDGLIFSGSGNGIIKIWSLSTGKCINTLKADFNSQGYRDPINTLTIVENILYSGSEDNKLTAWTFE